MNIQHILWSKLVCLLPERPQGEGRRDGIGDEPSLRWHAVQLRVGSIQSPVASFDISTQASGSPFENVADLIEAMPDQPDERLGWLLSLDTRDVDQLLAACTGALIDATLGSRGPLSVGALRLTAPTRGLRFRQVVA